MKEPLREPGGRVRDDCVGNWGLKGSRNLDVVNLKYVHICVWNLSEKNKFVLK